MKKKAKIVKDGGDKWILEMEGMDRAPWLYKDKVERSPMRGRISVGVEIEVELRQNDRKQWRVHRIFPKRGNNIDDRGIFDQKSRVNVFEFPKAAQPDENFYLKMFKQKRLFDDNYEFDKSYNTEFQKSKFNEAFVSGINTKHIGQIKAWLGEGKMSTDVVASPEWRMSLGIGGTSVYETGLTLHHIYGIPFIPATAVKGIVSSYVATQVYKDEVDALSNQDYCDVFGCNGEGKVKIDAEDKPFKSYYKQKAEVTKNEEDLGSRQGKVIFFDAFPQSKIQLVADIMNVHYKDWYGQGKPPGDWQNPNPITFLTIGKDTQFQFMLGVKREENIPLLAKAKTWLHSALTHHGIGAKTAVGYGYFKT